MQRAKVLTEDEITLSNLKKFFDGIYYKADLTDRGHLYVEVDGMLPVGISLDEHRKLLQFFVAYTIEYNQFTLKGVNRMNTAYNLARFSFLELEKGDCLYMDYDLSYEGGVTPHQLLSALRLFSRVVSSAIREAKPQIQEEDSGATVPESALH